MTISENVGFVGTGGIASAIARGLCANPEFTGKIYLSVHKNRTRADEIKALAPDRVVVTESNQEILDRAEVVFPALLPKVLPAVVQELRFRKANHIIHIAAGTKLSISAPWYAPAGSVVRSVPLPFAAKRIGPVVLYGDDQLSRDVLSLLGSVVKVKTEKDLEVLAAVTGIMVSYYGLVGEIIGWCKTKGMDFQNARDYTCFMNEALSTLMRLECSEDVKAFMLDNTTPGGMNELGWTIMKQTEAYKPWFEALEKIGKHYDL